MPIRELPLVLVAATVGVAAWLGGAFHPGQRAVVGVALAIGLAWSLVATTVRLANEEWITILPIIWGVVVAVATPAALLPGKEIVTTWTVAWVVWMLARRVRPELQKILLVVLLGAAAVLASNVLYRGLAIMRIRVGGPFENPNLAAALLVVMPPVALFLLREKRSMMVLAACALPTAAVVATGSRAGLLAVLAGGAVLLPRGRTRILGTAGGLFVMVAALAWRFATQPDVLAWYRPAIWAAVAKLWIAYPVVGVGPGGLVDAAGPVRILHADHVGQHQYLIAYAESSPLGLLVQLGAVGFVLGAVAVIAWLRAVHHRGGFRSPATSALVSAIAVMSAFHDLLTADVVLWWWALVVGLLEPRVAVPGADHEDRWRRVIPALVIGFLVAWGMVQPSFARWRWSSAEPSVGSVDRTTQLEPWADWPLQWRVEQLIAGQEWSWRQAGEALSRARRAVTLRPRSARLWANLAGVYARVALTLDPREEQAEHARAAFESACSREPYLPWHWLDWARFERSLGQNETARRLVLEATRAEPNTTTAWLLLARIELDAGRVDEAARAYRRARAASRLEGLSQLSRYERDLVAAPQWQFREIEESLP